MNTINPKVIGLIFAGFYACALALHLALSAWVAVAGPRPWDKTAVQHARDLLAGNVVEERIKQDVWQRAPLMTRAEKERRERLVPLWVRCVRNDMTDWLASDDRELSTRLDRHQASLLLDRFASACKAKLGIKLLQLPCRDWCGTQF